MLPDRVSNPVPLTYESGALPIALRGPAENEEEVDRKEVERLILKSGQEWDLSAPLGQLKTRQGGKGLLHCPLWCLDGLPRLLDRIE